MNKIFRCLLLLSSLLSAQSTIAPYAGLIDYTGSSKETGGFAGLYFRQEMPESRLELAYERTKIRYRNPADKDLEQNDVTAVYTNYYDKHHLFRLGGHYIANNDALTDGGTVLFGGLKYFEGYDFDLGADLYYAYYGGYSDTNNTSPSSASKRKGGNSGSSGLSVIQFSPNAGLAWGNYLGTTGSFYLKLYYDYITLASSGPDFLSNEYHSAGVVLKHFKGKWTTEVGGWAGRQSFAVRKEGFTVFNLEEEHRGGAQVSFSYAYSKDFEITLRYEYESFKEIDYDTAAARVLGGALNYHF